MKAGRSRTVCKNSAASPRTAHDELDRHTGGERRFVHSNSKRRKHLGISLTGTPAEPLAGRGARPGRAGSPGTSATRARARPQNPCEGRVWAALPLYTPLTPFLLGGLVKLNPCGGRSAAGAMAIIKKQKQTNKKPETTRAGGTWRGVGVPRAPGGNADAVAAGRAACGLRTQ